MRSWGLSGECRHIPRSGRARATATSGEYVVVSAERQTAGRGRAGRAWVMHPGQGVAFSVATRLPAGTSLEGLSLAVGAALAEALAVLDVPVRLKWPNDLLLFGGKLGGILIEAQWLGQTPMVIVGVGLNRYRPQEIGDDTWALAPAALADALAPVPATDALVAMLAQAVVAVLEDYRRGAGFVPWQASWWAHAAWRDRWWEWQREEGEPRRVRLLGLDGDGALRVEALDHLREYGQQRPTAAMSSQNDPHVAPRRVPPSRASFTDDHEPPPEAPALTVSSRACHPSTARSATFRVSHSAERLRPAWSDWRYLLLDLGNSRLKWWAGSNLDILLQPRAHPDPDAQWGSCPYEPAALTVLVQRWQRWLAADAAVWGVAVAGRERAAMVESALGRQVRWVTSRATAAGVRNGYAQPSQLGADRWVAAIGAWHLGYAPAVIVGAGTALTLDWLDTDGTFRGGWIAPGLATMAWALTHRTAQLPVIAFADAPSAPSLPPTSTVEAIREGCLAAAMGAIEHLLGQIWRQQPRARLVLMGGDAALLSSRLALTHGQCHNLVFAGLAAIARAEGP